MSVSAVNRKETDIVSDVDLRTYAGKHGIVPVTEFRVHGKTAVQISREAFKRLAVQLRVRNIEMIELEVVDETFIDSLG